MIMSEIFSIKPLGEILQLADLISIAQIEFALEKQTQHKNMRLGEILALQGWIKQETADFFAQKWSDLLNQKSKQPLGEYLKKAALLDEYQVKIILCEQKQMGLRFGELAVHKGWLKPTTINFFLEYIAPLAQYSQKILQQAEHLVESDNGRVSSFGEFALSENQHQKKRVRVASPSGEENSYQVLVTTGNFPQNAKFQIEDFTKHSAVSIDENLRQVELFIEEDKSSILDHKVHTKPLNRSIIKLFNLEERASRPDILLEEVLSWTSGQPFLTQKLCQFLADSAAFVPLGEEALTVQKIVQTHLIAHWETQVASEHFKAIRYGLLRNKKCNSFALLELYEQILQKENISVKDSLIKTELMNLGLVVEQGNTLKVSNRIYQSIFSLNWVNQELIRLDINRNRIKLFKLEEKASRPYVLLEEVLSWTSGQLFLTQKLCQLLANLQEFIPVHEEAIKVEELVQTRLIENWEIQVVSEHLEVIRDGILKNQQCNPLSMLQTYQQILQHKEVVVNNNPAQTELLNLGLVVEQENVLKVSNRIYQSVFSLSWVNQELEKQPSPISKITTGSQERQFPPPTIRLNHIKKTISNSKKALPKGRWILLGIVGLMIVGFSFVRSNTMKSLEVQILFKQGNDLFNQKKYQEAITKYDEILKIDQNYYQAWTNQGYAFAGLGQYKKMLESCTVASIIEQNAVYGWNCQGEALHNLKRYNEAIATFNKAIAIDSKDPIFWINKTESLLALKQIEQALVIINQAIYLLEHNSEIDTKDTIKRDLSVAYSHKGKALSREQKHKEALQAYNQSLAYDPNYFTAHRGRGIALGGLRRYDEATAQFERMLKELKLVDAQKAETLYYLGFTFCKTSKVQQALTAFNEALKLKPDYQAVESAKRSCSRLSQ
jgi:tetratricopeptide (TPR) repeat protein